MIFKDTDIEAEFTETAARGSGKGAAVSQEHALKGPAGPGPKLQAPMPPWMRGPGGGGMAPRAPAPTAGFMQEHGGGHVVRDEPAQQPPADDQLKN